MSRFKSVLMLRKSLLVCGAALGVFSSCPSTVCGLTGEWVTGTPETGQHTDRRFGAAGVEDDNNMPRGSTDMARWVDAEGNLYVYHGSTLPWQRPYGLSYDPDDPHLRTLNSELPYRMDLWKYSPASNNWTLVQEMSGPFKDTLNARASWVGDDGNLWLYNSMEIWYFDLENTSWTLHHRMPEVINYGTKGVADPANSPGNRGLPVTWIDHNNDIWQFGGPYRAPVGEPGGDWQSRTDLWKFDTSENMWTWVHGPNIMDFSPLYGIKGVPDSNSHPGGSGWESARWVDSEGNLWLYASAGEIRGGEQIWKFDVATSQWVWLAGGQTEDMVPPSYGELGVAAPGNDPGTRAYTAYWADANGDLWLFGGQGSYNNELPFENFSDLWKFNTSTNLWAWMGGPQNFHSLNTYVAPGISDPVNNPMGRTLPAAWVDPSGKLGLYGGEVQGFQSNDLWTYDTASGEWTFHKGSNGRGEVPRYESEDVAGPVNNPGSRSGAAEWEDSEGNLWVYGGAGYHRAGNAKDTNDQLGDLWKFDTATRQWTYKCGYVEIPAVYGQLGIEDPANTPGARLHAASWTDSQGYLWLYGGEIFNESNSEYNTFSDLWRYNPSTDAWAWMGGSQELSPAETPTNPAGRSDAAAWTDTAGDVWLFGGYSRHKAGHDPFGRPFYHDTLLNDLWRLDLDTLQWEQVLASQHTPSGTLGGSSGAHGTYCTLGRPDATSRPGGRRSATAIQDTEGNLWLFGGTGFGAAVSGNSGAGTLNDLWKLDPVARMWTWTSGDQTPGQLATLTGAPMPEGKSGAAGWAKDGNLIIHGGSTEGEKSNLLWVYHIFANQWSWVAPTEPSVFGTYNDRGVASEASFPGMRFHASAFEGADGALWLFGGEGYARWGYGFLDDLWKLDPGSIQAAPKIDLQLTSSDESPQSAVINTPFTWTLTVTNNGPEPAGGVEVTIDGDLADKADLSNIQLPASGSIISQTADKLVVTVGPLDPGAIVSVFVDITPRQTGDLKIKAAAKVIGPAFDPIADNSLEMELHAGTGVGANLLGGWSLADVKTKVNKKGLKVSLKITLMASNTGNVDAARSVVRYYLSDDAALGGDQELKPKKLGKLKVGKTKSLKVKLKTTTPLTGKYLIAVLDADGAVAETNELDNTVVSQPLP